MKSNPDTVIGTIFRIFGSVILPIGVLIYLVIGVASDETRINSYVDGALLVGTSVYILQLMLMRFVKKEGQDS